MVVVKGGGGGGGGVVVVIISSFACYGDDRHERVVVLTIPLRVGCA